MKTKQAPRRTSRSIFLLPLVLAIFSASDSSAQLYYQTNGTNATWNTAVWGSAATGPFTTAWSASSDVVFGVASGGTNNVTISTTAVGNMQVNGNTTFAGTGTISNKVGGSTVTVADGVTLAMSAASWSGTASAFNWTKAGNGTWDLSTMSGTAGVGAAGITLNAGTLISRGSGNFGGANGRLTINGGVFAWSGARTYSSAMTWGGNFGISNLTANNATNSGSVNITGLRTITYSASNDFRITGAITNIGGIILTNTATGTGKFILAASNDFSGGVTMNAGTLEIQNANALGSGTLTLAGGVIGANSSALLITNAMSATGNFTFGTGAGGSTFNGNMDLTGGSRTITAANTTTLGGAISNGTLALASGTLKLSGSADTTLNVNITATSPAALDITNTASGITIGSLAGGANATIDLGSKALTIGGNSYSTTYSGVITNTGSLVKSGTGTLTLGTANTFSGGAVLTGGFLGYGASNALGTGNIVLNGGALAPTTTGSRIITNNIVVSNNSALGGLGQSITLDGGINLAGGSRTITLNNSATFNGIISNGTGFTLDSDSSTRGLTLNAVATYTGATTLNGGTLTLGASGGISSSSALNIAASTTGATFNASGISGTSLTLGSIAGGANGTLNLGGKSLTAGADNSSTTFAGAITGAGGSFTKVGSGTIALSGSNNYTGGTTLSAGTMEIRNNDALGTGTLVLNGGVFGSAGGGRTNTNAVVISNNFSIGGLGSSTTLNGNVDLAGGTRTITHLGNSFTFGGVISNGGLTLDSTNSARTLTLSGANTFNGGLTINASTVAMSGAGSLDSSLAVNVAAATTNATFDISNISGSSLTVGSLAGGANGTLALGGKNLTFGGNNANTTFAGTVTGATGGSITKTGSGTVTLSGSASHTGGTTISGGAISGDTRSLQGAISNDARVIFNQSTNGTYAGSISGTGAFDKAGSGTVTLSANNTLSGATTVQSGKLVVNGTNANSAVTVNSTATLGGSGQVGALTIGGLVAPGNSVGTLSAGNTTLLGGGSFQLEMYDWTNSAGTGWDLLAVTGDLTLNNTSGSQFTINLVSMSSTNTSGNSINWNANANWTNTFLTYSGSLLSSFDASAFNVNATSFLNTPTNGVFTITNVSGGLALLYTTSYNPSAIYEWNAGSGAWSDGANWAGTVAPSDGADVIFSGATGGNSTNTSVGSIIGLTFSNTAGSFTVSGNAMTNGAGGIVNNSANTQTVNNDLTLGAAQTFNAAAGNLSLGGAISNGGFRLTVDGSNNTTFSGAISGSGGLTKNGAGTATLAGANSYGGGTVVSAGVLAGDTTGLQGTITNNAVVAFSQSANGTYGGVMSGSGKLTKDGSGTVTLGGANTYSGGTLVSAGAFRGDTTSLQGTITNNATLVYNQTTNNATSISNISGTGSLVKEGAGALQLGGNTYGGGTIINAGAIYLGSATALGTGTLTMGDGTVLSSVTSARTNSNNVALAGNVTFGLTSGGQSTTFNGNFDLTGSTRTITLLNSATVAGVISNGGITLDNTGPSLRNLTLTASNTFANGLTVNGGNVILSGSGSLNSSGAVNLAATTTNASLDISAITASSLTIGSLAGGANGSVALGAKNLAFGGDNSSTTIAGAISGTGGSLTKSGNGTVTLSGANSYTGGTTVSAGGLSGDTRGLQGAIANNGTVSFAQTTNGTYSGAMSGNGSLVKSGSGTVTLSGANTYSGGTTISAGGLTGDTLSLQGNILNDGTLAFSQTTNGSYAGIISGAGLVTKAGSGTVTLSGANTYGGNTLISAGALRGDTTSLQGTITNNATLVFNQTTNGTFGSLRGNGVLVKEGSATLQLGASSSYTGTTTLNAGAIAIASANAFGSGAVTINTGTAIGAVGGNRTNANNFVFAGNFTNGLATAASPGSLTINGTVDLGGGTRTISLENSMTLNGIVSNGGLVIDSINATNTRNLTLGAANTFTGGVTMNGGNLRLTGSGALSSASAVNLAATTTNASLDITNITALSTTIGSLAGGANSTVDLGAKSLTFGDSTASTTYAGVITGTGGSIVKQGSGIVILSGDNNYTGGTTVSAGTLQVGNGGATGLLGSGDINITNASASLLVNRTGTLSISGVISGDGSVTKTGSGTLSLTSSNSYTGGTVINAGAIQIDGVNRLGSAAGALTINAGKLLVSGGLSSGRNIVLGNANSTIEVDSGVRYTANSNSIVSGSGTLNKAGSGTLALAGVNTYSGGNIVGGGTLIGTTDSIKGNAVVSNSAVIFFDQSTNGTYAGVLSGAGALVKSNAGTLTLTANSTMNGGNLIAQGALQLGNGSTTGSLNGPITNNGTLIFNRSDSLTESDVISGGGSVTKTGSGTIILSGANSYSGGTVVSQGTLSGDTTSLQGAIANSGTVTFSQTTNGQYTGALSGSGGVTKSGSGTLTLGGDNNGYNGAISLQAGGLIAANNNALGSQALTVTNGSVQLANGVTVGNSFTIGAAGSASTNFGSTTVLAGWNFNGVVNFGTNNMIANTLASGVSNSTGLTRGSGVSAGTGGATGGWGGTNWQTTSQSQAISSNQFITFALTADPTKVLRFSSVNPFEYRRSGTGATNGALQFSINGVDFTDITNSIAYTSSSSSGSSLGSISLSSLADVASGTTITFRLVNWGGTGAAGTWYFYDVGTDAADDFALNGQVGTITTNAPSGSGTLGIAEAGSATYTGNVENKTSATLTAVANGQATFSGIISGAGNINKTGSGTVILSGANTYNGGTLVADGTLRGDTTSLQGTITNNATLVYDQNTNNATSLTGLLGNGTLVKEGSATLQLGASGSYTGNTTLNAGTLRLNNINAIGSGALTQTDGTSTLQVNVAGTITNNMSVWRVAYLQGANLSGALSLSNTVFDVTNNVTATNSGTLSGTGGVDKIGAGTLLLSGNNSYSGGTSISNGAVSVSADNNLGAVSGSPTAGNVTLDGGKLLATSGFTLDSNRGVALGASGGAIEVASGQTLNYGGVAAGSGALTKSGIGTMTLTGASTYSGATTVSAGTLELANTSGAALGSTASVSVGSGATLLISQNQQVNNTATVSLSGGTIRTAAGISETFGNLTVTGSGFLDFGTTSYANANTINFGTYTPSALLTIANFDFGSTLTFKSDLSGSINNLSLFSFSNGGIASYSFNSGTSTFTITAIPEPSTYLAAVGLIGLMLWPSRRRLIKDVKSILGLRAPARDRLVH